jgi:HEAT repeat protein
MGFQEWLRRRKVERALKRLASNSHWESRVAAAKAIGELGAANALTELVSALQQGCGPLRAAAAEALGKINTSQAIEPLVESLGDKEAQVRTAATAALERLGQPKWKAWVKGDNADFGRLAASRDPAALSALAPILADDDPGCVKSVIEAMQQLGDRRAVKPLASLLESRKTLADRYIGPVLRLWMQLAVPKEQQGPSCVVRLDERESKAVNDLVAEKVRNVRIAAVQALGHLGGADAAAALAMLENDDDYEVQQTAANCLAELRSRGRAEQGIGFACTCGRRLRVPEAYAGKMVKCPACAATIICPRAEK